jgi:inner membrane protein YidH
MNKPEERFEVSGTASSHFAWLRTRLALERTLMAWARTSVSLIGFGFTIVKFLESLQSSAAQGGAALLPQAPRYFGLALIGAGVLGLLISVWQYHKGVRYLWSDQFRAVAGVNKETPYTTPIVFVAIILTLVGIFAFVVILLRLT